VNVFEKADKVCKIVESELKVCRNDFFRVVGRLVNNWHQKSRRGVKLSKVEVMVYELLLRKKYNPSTVYRWLLVTSAPSEVRDKLKMGKISIREALQLRNKLRQQFSTNDEQFKKEVIWHIEEYIL